MTRDNIVCLICEKKLEHDHSENFGSSIPGILDATVWRTTGNWGSSLFDSFDSREFLETYICDECLVKKSKIIYHVDVAVKQVETTKVTTFDNRELS